MAVPTAIDRDDDRQADPLAAVTAPPRNETPLDRQNRIKKEAQDKMQSDAIDEEIARVRSSQRRKAIKILLLGQSESGKSTTLKNFQLAHAPRQFREERSSWRSVIYLNILRSVRLILEAIVEAQAHANRPVTANPFFSPSSPPQTHHALTSTSISSLRPSTSSNTTEPPTNTTQLTETHHELRARLGRLAIVEDRLIKRLAAKGETEATSRTGTVRELAVLASSRWQSTVSRLRGVPQADNVSTAEREREEALEAEMREEDDVARELRDAKSDIEALWADPVIRGLPTTKKLRMEELPGFFLDCLDRMTAPNYIPTDDDVLKARLKTLGVSEYKFILNYGYMIPPELKVYDVGGTRSQREYWVPYFDDMDAMIFLAPISCFDQTLVEDPSVNRLEDSIKLWRTLCKNKLLAKCHLVLFLNKCDILERKLESGIRFSKWVVTYGKRPNDFEAVSAYLKRKFEGIQKDASPTPRPFYCHFTSLTDSRTTLAILTSVMDMVMRANLTAASLV